MGPRNIKLIRVLCAWSLRVELHICKNTVNVARLDIDSIYTGFHSHDVPPPWLAFHHNYFSVRNVASNLGKFGVPSPVTGSQPVVAVKPGVPQP